MSGLATLGCGGWTRSRAEDRLRAPVERGGRESSRSTDGIGGRIMVLFDEHAWLSDLDSREGYKRGKEDTYVQNGLCPSRLLFRPPLLLLLPLLFLFGLPLSFHSLDHLFTLLLLLQTHKTAQKGVREAAQQARKEGGRTSSIFRRSIEASPAAV